MTAFIQEYQIYIAGFVLFLAMIAGLILYSLVYYNHEDNMKTPKNTKGE